MEEIRFTISGNPVTKKNSQRIIKHGNYYKIIPSKAFLEYQESAGYLIPCKWKNIDTPVNVKALFYMKTLKKVDITNLNSALHDILTHYGVLADDSSLSPQIVASTDGSRVYYDKDNPRVEVTITDYIE